MSAKYNIESIKQELKDILHTIPPTRLECLRKVISSSITKLNEPMQLAIIGKISSSKSTLVNAILGKDEVMATGQLEVTYNVGWLKYGLPKSDIQIHYKDDRPKSTKNPEEFLKWSIAKEGQSELRDNVSYIETFNDAEILKDINIIDTPGLDALRGQDSQNTIDFLQQVKPDAVIMLFTHSISESILDVVKDFNRGGDFNPLNAVGVLSKIDVLWMEDMEREQSALDIGKRIAENKIKQNPSLRKKLFSIYPISSLLFLKASTLTENELELLKRLVVENSEILPCLMLSAIDFVDPDYEVSMNIETRKMLLAQLDLYAIDLITKMIIQSPDSSLESVKEMLYQESGAAEFMKTMHNHFGSRAELIKMESVYSNIHRQIESARSDNQDIEAVINGIEQRLNEVFSSLIYEHREYELLNRIYCNEIDLDENIAEEYCRLCGEFGYSVPIRLGLDNNNVSTSDMIKKIKDRERYWRTELNSEFDPDEKEWMQMMLSSYTHLLDKVKIMDLQYTQAKAFLYNN